MLAAVLASYGIGGFIRAVGAGAVALMPSAATPLIVGAGVLALLAKVGVAIFVLFRLRREDPAGEPSWLALVLVIAFGLTGALVGLGSASAQAFFVARAMDMGILADISMTQAIVATVAGVLYPLIDIGTLVAAAWLWQSQPETLVSEAKEPALPNDSSPA